MADAVISGVEFDSARLSDSIQVGEAVAAFDIVYLDSVTRKYWLTDVTDVNKTLAAYMVLLGAAQDKFVSAIKLQGDLRLTVTPNLTVGDQYVLSANNGKVAPRADLLTGQFITHVFLGAEATLARFNANQTSIAVP